jgi:hypothetical protein
MGILGRSFRSSHVIRIDSRVLAKIAIDAYEECGVDYCCDPTEMAERLGFDVRMTDGHGEIVGRVLFVPMVPSRRLAGESSYRLLARFLVNRSHHPFRHEDAVNVVADELMLPRHISDQVESTELPALQRYVTLDTLRRISMQRRDSGVFEVAEDSLGAGAGKA